MTRPTVDQMAAAALTRNSLPEWRRDQLRDQLAQRRLAIDSPQAIPETRAALADHREARGL